MSPQPTPSPAIEALQRLTSRLADSNLTIDEANLLLPLIQRLVEEIGAGGSRAMVPARFVRSEEGRSNRNMPSAQVPSAVEPGRSATGGPGR
jgi:hypothetical protein